MKRRLFVPISVMITLLFAGVALASDSDTDPIAPSEPEFRVGDQVNGGRVIEVSEDEIVVEFVDPAPR